MGEGHFLKGHFKKGARGIELFGGIQGHSKKAPTVTTTFQWGAHTRLQQGTKATRKKGTYFWPCVYKYLEGHSGHF